MNFFDPPPDLPEFKPPPRPAWAWPPDSQMGVSIPARGVVARASEVVIGLADCVVYSNGFEIHLTVLSRTPRDPHLLGFGMPPNPARPLREDMLRVGIQFADGRKATAHFPAGEPRAYPRAISAGHDPPLPEGPLMLPRGGGGGGTRWDHRYWVWPLPPPGPVHLVCEWPSEGIPVTFHDLGGDQIRAAAAEVTDLWTSPLS